MVDNQKAFVHKLLMIMTSKKNSRVKRSTIKTVEVKLYVVVATMNQETAEKDRKTALKYSEKVVVVVYEL